MKNCYFYWFSLINCTTNSVSLHTIYASTELPKALKCSRVSTFFRHCFHYSSLPRSALLHVQCVPLSFIPAPLIFVSSFVDSPQWQMYRVSILRMSLRLSEREIERGREREDRTGFSTCLLFLLISALPRPAVQHRVDNYRWNDFIRLSATGPRCRQSR